MNSAQSKNAGETSVKSQTQQLLTDDGGSKCHVCDQILSVFSAPFSDAAKVELGNFFEVVNSECDHATWIRKSEYRITTSISKGLSWYQGYKPYHVNKQDEAIVVIRKRRNASSITLVIEIPNDSPKCKKKLVETHVDWELLGGRDLLRGPGRAIMLNSEYIDMKLMKSWIHRCRYDHGHECETPSWFKELNTASPKWLIDVTQGCIVPSELDTSPYLTLSYTWGQVEQLRNTVSNLPLLRKPGALTNVGIATDIPDTVSNAIQLTRKLGFKRLWVDSLCITQDDATELQSHLRNMHGIYANSFLTIVAAHGEDANNGLKGLRDISVPRNINHEIVSLGCGMTIQNCDAVSGLGCSYHQRAWTFQEFVFSKRRLYFRNGIVEWQCSQSRWLEYLRPLPGTDLLMRSPELWRSGEWMEAHIPSITRISALIGAYNTRRLSFPEDVVGAFSGIQSMLNTLFAGGLLYGHPILFFEASLLWIAGRVMKRRIPSKQSTHLPDANHIPSWSWMGWEGSIYYSGDMDFAISKGDCDGYLEPVTQWYTIAHPGQKKQMLHSNWHKYKTRSEDNNMPLGAGWTKHRYTPPTWRIRAHKHKVPSLPKVLSKYVYQHDLEPETGFWFRPYQFWYPVPVRNKNRRHEPERSAGFLFCRTDHLFFHITRVTRSSIFLRNFSGVQELCSVNLRNENGTLSGTLSLNQQIEREALIDGDGVVELVAVATGYTTVSDGEIMPTFSNEESTLSLENRNIRVSDGERDAPPPLRDGEAYFRPLCPDDPERLVEEMREEYWKDNKWDCYFVLYIEWEGCVAYRKGSGVVLKEAWENYKRKGTNRPHTRLDLVIE
ncbi:heterokaryon incompatibility protein-domain-containing protein [Xylariaceae sp. FL0255]|nr:heterokaryon incompatibility protein-domain-containing protein [Xylariaceae sp. FL0255]